ncbi:MAG: hypothetical protein ACTSUT_13565 [Promethearchaeota archaeon]
MTKNSRISLSLAPPILDFLLRSRVLINLNSLIIERISRKCLGYLILTIIIIALYMWKYEKNNPIIPDNWTVDAIVFGVILCGMNFLLDILFFGMMGRNLISYFWLETTTGYFYPLIILETFLIAYLIYGRKE